MQVAQCRQATSARPRIALSGRHASFVGRRRPSPPCPPSNRRPPSHAQFELKAVAAPDVLPPSPTRRPDEPSKAPASPGPRRPSDKPLKSKRALRRGIPCGEPPATGLPQEPRLVQTTPACYNHGTQGAFRTQPVYMDLNADTAPWLRGLDHDAQRRQLHQHYRKVPAAFGSAALDPETAADTLDFIGKYYAPLLAAKAPGGDSVLVAHPVGIPEMLDGALQCCDLLWMEDGKRAEGPQQHKAKQALTAAAAGVALMSHLSFGSQASASKYQAKWFRLRERISSAATALGPAAIPEEAVVGLYESCARGPLLMTPWFGNTFADAAEQHLQAGFSSPKAALTFAESWATLVARGRFQFVAQRFETVMSAVNLAQPLSDAQLQRALAIPALLPVEARLSVRSWSWEA